MASRAPCDPGRAARLLAPGDPDGVDLASRLPPAVPADRRADRLRHRPARVYAPERKSLTERPGSPVAGVKIRQQIAFVGKRQGPGDEERGALCSGSLRSSD